MSTYNGLYADIKAFKRNKGKEKMNTKSNNFV